MEHSVRFKLTRSVRSPVLQTSAFKPLGYECMRSEDDAERRIKPMACGSDPQERCQQGELNYLDESVGASGRIRIFVYPLRRRMPHPLGHGRR